ncbi:MAG: hypothetical protein AB8G99_16610 [Planctomycetaceae bacterium]
MFRSTVGHLVGRQQQEAAVLLKCNDLALCAKVGSQSADSDGVRRVRTAEIAGFQAKIQRTGAALRGFEIQILV